MKVTIPEYLSIKHWKNLQHLNNIDEVNDKVLYTLSSLINVPMEDIEKWPLSAVTQVNKEIVEVLNNVKPEFYPVIEWQDRTYGYLALSKMTMAEWVDLSNLITNPTQNINEILALLYRPITKNNINSVKYITKSTFKSLKYEVENVFDYYDIEEYDSAKRKQVADEYNEFPAEIALGGLNFFMLTGLNLSNDTQSSFPNLKQMIMKMKMNKTKSALLSTTLGYTLSTKYQIPKSYPSQETEAY